MYCVVDVSVGLCVLYVLLYLVVDMCCSSLLMCDVSLVLFVVFVVVMCLLCYVVV